MPPLILRLNVSGHPVGWMPWREAVLLYARDQVAWTLGEEAMRIHGGINRITSLRSYMDIHPIIAAKGAVKNSKYGAIPPLTNRELFRRDRHTCMYCLKASGDKHLTRDHIIPVSRGGKEEWPNVITACRSCNQRKGSHMLHEISMKLHAVPYTPNHAEWLILRNRNILTDQMAFLKARCPKERRELM